MADAALDPESGKKLDRLKNNVTALRKQIECDYPGKTVPDIVIDSVLTANGMSIPGFIIFNPEYLATKSDNDLMFTYVHEAGHEILGHIEKRKEFVIKEFGAADFQDRYNDFIRRQEWDADVFAARYVGKKIVLDKFAHAMKDTNLLGNRPDASKSTHGSNQERFNEIQKLSLPDTVIFNFTCQHSDVTPPPSLPAPFIDIAPQGYKK